MSENTLEIFKNLFKNEKPVFQNLLLRVRPLITAKETAIADFLGDISPEVVWVINTFGKEYDKQFRSYKQNSLVEYVSQIAQKVAITLQEAGVDDYAIKQTQNIVENTINNIIENTDKENVIVIEDTPVEMDTLEPDDMQIPNETRLETTNNQQTTKQTPNDTITRHDPINSDNNNNNNTSQIGNNTITSTVAATSSTTITTTNSGASSSNKTSRDTQSHDQSSQLLTQTISTNINTSMHAKPLNQDDLRHTINNKLKHNNNNHNINITPVSSNPAFRAASIITTLSPGRNRGEKIRLIQQIFEDQPGFLSCEWKFYQGNSNIILTFASYANLIEAIKFAHSHFLDIPISIISDPSYNISRNVNINTPIYKLKAVPHNITTTQIADSLNYFGNITDITEHFKNKFDNQRDVTITFQSTNTNKWLFKTWSVNINGQCIRIAHNDESSDSLKARNNFVAGFKGFKNNTTPAHALRSLRPFGGKSCYFHNNIAYINFETKTEMDKACSQPINVKNQTLYGKPRKLNNPYNPPNNIPSYIPKPPTRNHSQHQHHQRQHKHLDLASSSSSTNKENIFHITTNNINKNNSNNTTSLQPPNAD